MRTLGPILSHSSLPLLTLAFALGACGGGVTPSLEGSSGSGSGASGSSSTAPPSGTSDFQSAPAPGAGGGAGGATALATGSASVPAANAGASAGTSTTTSAPRTVEETDLYALDGNLLYYLNSYRGLMVFDLTQVDQPKFLGRYGIFGTPIQMIVNGGLAVVVVADWYGATGGQPFHGSVVEGLDATDPTNIKLVGQAPLGGVVQDTRVVGNVLYAVSEDYDWVYGWANAGIAVSGGVAIAPGGVSVGGGGADVIVSSVSFAGGVIQQVSSKTYAGYGGVFNVTPNSIMLAHQAAAAQPNLPAPAKTDLEYLDISDPGGAIVERGQIEVDGSVEGWGADNGRWSLDFADGLTAHVIGTTDTGSGYVLATVDFSNPDAPALDSELAIPSSGWTPTARFDTGRMYLSPTSYSPVGGTTPLQIFDLSNPAAPVLASTTQIPGSVWIMIPSGNQLFALGQDSSVNSEQVSLKYLDVTSATSPQVLGTSDFGEGWASTPATDTFKAFTYDPTQGLVVLPFSGWDSVNQQYNNGVQLIDFTTTSITTAGAAHSNGWVERGIFANGRIVSLSDLALSVVNYADRLAPTVTAQLTLARNVIASQPAGSTIAEISSDWWGNDNSTSDVRVLPITDAAETLNEAAAPDVSIKGVDARVFTNGERTYVVTNVQVPATCGSQGVYGNPGGPVVIGGPATPQQCYAWQERVQVVDLTGGTATARGSVALPVDPSGYYWSWGWGGFYYYDWFDGGEIVQVGGDALAFRRWNPNFTPNGQYIDASCDLFVVDLSNPDAPTVASVVVTTDPNGWWGDMKVVNNILYTTHYEWPSGYSPNGSVKYYLDPIDLSDRANPKIGSKINVPGVLIGGSTTDPTILYTIDYWWNGNDTENNFDVVKLYGDKAYLLSKTTLDGWVGNVFLSDDGNTAYTSTQRYVYVDNEPSTELHQIGLSDPTHPVDQVASGPKGWGWLVGVNGNRMLVTSGWGDGNGLDVYKLAANAAPAYDQFVRTQGWSISAIARLTTPESDQLFLSSGDWGVQVVTLQ